MPSNLTAENFVQVGSHSADDMAKLNDAIQYLSQSPDGARILQDMADRGVQIDMNSRGINSYTRDDGVVHWDATVAIATINNDGSLGGVASPALALLHEGSHALDPQIMNYDVTSPAFLDTQWTNVAEAFAGQMEAGVAQQLGEPVRENHKATADVYVYNPTLHTQVNSDGSLTWMQSEAGGIVQTGGAYTPEWFPLAPTLGASPDPDGDYLGALSDDGTWVGPTNDTAEFVSYEWAEDAGCVSINSFLPDGSLAGLVMVGERMQLADEVTLEKGTGVVTYSKEKPMPGFRITTTSGASLVCSSTAPIPVKAGGLLVPEKLLGHAVAVRWDEQGKEYVGWENIVSVESVGLIQVQHITVGDKCFWAGEKKGAYILHHNQKNYGGGGGGYDPYDDGPWVTTGGQHQSVAQPGAGAQLVGVAPPAVDHINLL